MLCGYTGVAKALQHIKQDIVFVGGAMVNLYTNDPAADEIRPTKAIDMPLNIINLSHWEKVQTQLVALGFHPDPFGHAICSYKDISIDIMATENGPLGPANRWCKIGFENLWSSKAKNQEIKILSAPCYLATKFEAFNDRGSDYRISHDIEDIIYARFSPISQTLLIRVFRHFPIAIQQILGINNHRKNYGYKNNSSTKTQPKSPAPLCHLGSLVTF